MTDTDNVNAAVKGRREEEGGNNESEGREHSKCMSHSMAIKCDHTLLDYRVHKGFTYSDITCTSKILLL